MKAQVLSICVPNLGCSKNCPYCVSKMTGHTEYASGGEILANLPKIKALAEKTGITTVLITGKGDPFYNDNTIEWVKIFIKEFQNYIVEIQSNGLDLEKYGIKLLGDLRGRGLNTIAFSIDHPNQFQKYSEIFTQARSFGLIVRTTINLINTFKNTSFQDFIRLCLENHVHQLTFRNISIPLVPVKTEESLKTKKWILENVDQGIYPKLINEFLTGNYPLLRTLMNGAKVYDVNGISFTHFDYCIQDNNNNEDIRSLIFDEDGHCYDNWGSRASIIF